MVQRQQLNLNNKPLINIYIINTIFQHPEDIISILPSKFVLFALMFSFVVSSLYIYIYMML